MGKLPIMAVVTLPKKEIELFIALGLVDKQNML